MAAALSSTRNFHPPPRPFCAGEGRVGTTTVVFPRSSRPQTHTICYAFAQLRFSKTVKKACWLMKFSDKFTFADYCRILRSLYTADGTRLRERSLRMFYEFTRKPGYCYRQIIVKSTNFINRQCTLRHIYYRLGQDRS